MDTLAILAILGLGITVLMVFASGISERIQSQRLQKVMHETFASLK